MSFTLRVMSGLTSSSCTAQNRDLDGDGGPRAHIHTAQLRATMDLRALWDNYGIVGDVEVCLICKSVLLVLTTRFPSALYSSFSSRGHPRTDRTRPPPSVNKRYF